MTETAHSSSFGLHSSERVGHATSQCIVGTGIGGDDMMRSYNIKKQEILASWHMKKIFQVNLYNMLCTVR